MSTFKDTTPTITVQVRSVYGVATTYPLCDAGRRFAAIAGTQTLTEPVLREIRALGFRVIEVPAPSGALRLAA